MGCYCELLSSSSSWQWLCSTPPVLFSLLKQIFEEKISSYFHNAMQYAVSSIKLRESSTARTGAMSTGPPVGKVGCPWPYFCPRIYRWERCAFYVPYNKKLTQVPVRAASSLLPFVTDCFHPFGNWGCVGSLSRAYTTSTAVCGNPRDNRALTAARADPREVL